ncbi:hypothetical protein [Teredinibacter turnerae]|uniref:Membrane protein n=1 Tax=Teredinibacter turnerae (strain ATCC 39867 / T7901) TaxID=377629 RepID=C5BQ13_TERTT|nr:hypothetical protein [Teredinibacter turnerae]ACR11254.1 putative membrane protein [Teredinibacter turnerae T7901]
MQIALLIGYPVLVFFAGNQSNSALASAALLFLLLGIVFHPLKAGKTGAIVAVLLASVGLAVAAYLHFSLWLMKLPAIAFPLFLLVIFAGSLLPGREALVTAIGEHARGPLSENMRRYTRAVTILWSVLFLVMVVVGGVTLLPSVPEWQAFVAHTVLYPVSGIVFIGEFFVRKLLFPRHDHPSFIEYLKIVTSAGVVRPSLQRAFHD